MSNPTAAMIVIGDEILSGRTRDSNMHHLAGELTKVGIDLKEVRVVSDDHGAIIAAVQALSGAYAHVFTSGGIGPTHDDITADCIAAAFNRDIDVRDDAREILAEHYARAGTQMNDAPGFVVENVHVMAGVPTVFQAMVASVLPGLTGGQPLISETLRIDRGEGDIAGPLGALAEEYPHLSMGSYPFQKDGIFGAHVVIRGSDPGMVEAAMVKLKAAFA
jgi:molybdenum cofactor synthesis domain-containing protein